MKVRLTVNVGAAERYVIARYFGESAAEKRDQVRPKATRKQVARFVLAALAASVKEQAGSLTKKRHRTRAQRLLAAEPPPVVAPLPEPPEQQLRLVET